MSNRFLHTFTPIGSTAPGFSATVDNTSATFPLEVSSLREWAGPTSRTIRVTSAGSNDFHMAIGSSTIVVSSSEHMRILGGTVEVFHQFRPSDTFISFVSSTDVVVNCTLGYGN